MKKSKIIYEGIKDIAYLIAIIWGVVMFMCFVAILIDKYV